MALRRHKTPRHTFTTPKYGLVVTAVFASLSVNSEIKSPPSPFCKGGERGIRSKGDFFAVRGLFEFLVPKFTLSEANVCLSGDVFS